jgi:DnaJ-class molecular chaperone
MSARWMICQTCSGDGSHSRALGVVDPNDFDPEEWERYIGGGYDQTCGTCGGSGKVRTDDADASLAHRRQLCAERLGDFHAQELYS